MTKSNSTYQKDLISQGITPERKQQIAIENATRTTIRLQLTKRELWLCISLTETLGGKTAGLSYRMIIQHLLKSLLASRLKDGTITDLSNIEAIKLLERFQENNLSDPGNINFESLDELALVEKESQETQKKQIVKALKKATKSEQTQGLDNLFPLGDYLESE